MKEGRLFIAWLDTCGRSLANILAAWVQHMFPSVEPSLGPDISKDSNWQTSLPQAARGADAALLCVIGQQANSPWLHLQLGVCFRAVREEHPVVPVLLDLEPEEVASTPLSLFQAVSAIEHDFSRLVGDLGHSFSFDKHQMIDVQARFRADWPELIQRLARVPGPSLHGSFQVVLVLPDAVIPIPNSAPATDEEWTSLMRRTTALQRIPGSNLRSFSVSDLTPLDLAREEWMQPPQLVSRLRTRNVALVHNDVRKSYQDEAKAVSKFAKLQLAQAKRGTT